ncbi:MAG: sugar ABC transporter substrate-binding protein [Eubacteriales bacterium]|nr:sugar ABC transporter substrate-binding protein [Eubacteriales bacterium]
MKVKSIIALLLVTAMVFACVACAPAAPVAEAPAAEAPAAEAPAAEAPAAEAPAAEAVVVDKDFTIDPSKIPQEKLDTTLYLAVSVRGLENPYIASIKTGMEMFAEYLDSIGQKYEMQVLDSQGDSDKEVDNMRQFAAKANGNAIAYSDPNENAIAYPLAEAMAESGGFVGTAWNKPDDVGPADLTPNWVIHTSPDNVLGGYNIAKALFDAMGGEGEVFVVQGMLGNTAATARYEGLQKALAEYPNIKVVEDDTGNWATAEALALVETWLTAHPNVGGIWCANDNMATGALQALDAKGLKGKVGVVGIDANTDIVEAVRDGFATATVSSNGYLQGGYTLAICYAAWAGLYNVEDLAPEYREFATPSTLVTKDNAAAMLSEVPTFDFSKPFACKAD